MLKTEFKSQLEFDIYLTEQKIRQENQYLSRSERETLKKMLEKDYKPTFIKEEKTKFPIVTNINELKNPCTEVVKEDNIKEIIQKLKDTLESNGGLGLTANQIDIQKRISYIKVPKYNKEKKIEFNEYILINAKIIEKQTPLKVKNEGCLSFPGVYVDTKRYVFIIVQYLNEKMELQNGIYQDLEGICIQHEIDHQNGLTIFDRKWRAK
jgi:peptide deformylase